MYSDRNEFPFPNAVICDLTRGDESGIDFLRWVKSVDEVYKTLPVFILANGDSADEISGRNEIRGDGNFKKTSSTGDLHNMLVDVASKLCALGTFRSALE
jgi:DNA-binding NarL/FixJ family response regulator